MTSRYYLSSQTSSLAQGRKEVLWNVQEPGDPYDIRKSMIATLPGGRPFMGDHLEVVCLLQAGQIQRLSDFLEIYRFKIKDLERIELDRHSYQIQIKQLTQKISEMDALQSQNQKLKEFAKKQGNQISSFQQNVREKNYQQEIQEAYEKSLERINLLISQNTTLREENIAFSRQVENVTAILEATERARQKEIEEMKMKLSLSLSSSSTLKNQSESILFQYRSQAQGEITKLQEEIRKLQELTELKNRQISQLRQDNSQLFQQNNRLSQNYELFQKNESSIKTINESELNRLKQEYQTKIAFLTQELEHRNHLLKQSTLKYQDIHRKNIDFEQKILQYELRVKDDSSKLKHREEDINRLNELIMKIDREGARVSGESQQLQLQYQSKIRQLSQEIQSLSSRLHLETSQSRNVREESERKSFQSSSKFQILTRQNEELKKAIIEMNELKRQIAHNQSERSLLIQEIERLNELNNNKNKQLDHFRNLVGEKDNLKSRISQIQRIWQTKYESQLIKVRSQYDVRLNEMAQMKGNEFQSRAAILEQQLDKSKIILQSKTEEAEKHKKVSFQWQSKYNQLQLDQSYKLKNYEVSINALKKENEDIYAKIRQAKQAQMQLIESKNKIILIDSEVQQLRTLIRTREEEISTLRARLTDTEGEFNRKYNESSKKLGESAQKIVTLTSQNQQLRRKVTDLIAAKNVGNQAITELNRLNIVIRTLQDDKIQAQSKTRQLTQQLEYHKQNLNLLTKEKEELRKMLTQFEINNKNLMSQSSSNLKNMQLQNENLRRQINDLKITLTNYESEAARRGVGYQQNLNSLTRENEQLRKKLRQIEGSLSQFYVQTQKLNQKYRLRGDELISMQSKYKNATIEMENLKKYIKQYQITVTSKLDGEVARKYQNYEQTIQTLTFTYEQSKRKGVELQNKLEDMRKKQLQLQNRLEEARKRYNDLENRYNQLNIEYEKMIITMKNLTQQLQTIKRQKAHKQGLITTFESDINKKITEYQNSIFNMTRSKEQLQRKINQNDMLLKQRYEECNRLEASYRSITQELEISKRRYNELENIFSQKMEGQVISKYKIYDRTIEELTRQREELRRKLIETGSQLEKRVIEINKLSPVVGENQHLRKRIQTYDSSISAYEAEVNRQFVNYQKRIDGLSKENQELKRKINEGLESTRKISLQSEDKVTILSRELEKTISNFKILERENSEIKMRLTQLGDLGRVVAELENKLAITTQQLERINSNLRVKTDDFNKLQLKNRTLVMDLEAAKRQNTEIESRMSYTLESEVPKKYNSYEQTISELRRKINDLQFKNQSLTLDLERSTNGLKVKGEESTQLINNYKSISNEFDQFKRRTKQTETISAQNIQNLRAENDELKRRLQQFQGNLRYLGQTTDKKVIQYQTKFKIMIQQIQRLNKTVTDKNDQLDRIIKKSKEYQLILNQKSQLQLKNKVLFENTVNNLKRQNEEMRRKLIEYGDLNQRVNDYSNNLRMAGQQYDKTSTLLKMRNEQFSQLQLAYKNLVTQNEELKRRIRELTQINKRIIEYEQKINIILQENEKLQYALKNKTDQFGNADMRVRQYALELEQAKRQIVELERSLTNKFQMEINRKTTNYEQNLLILNREREDLHRKKMDYETKITMLTSEIERLNMLIRTRTEELQRALQETESYRQHSERKILTNQSEKTTLQSNYNTIVSELEASRKNLYEYEGKVMKLNGQFDRLKSIINQLQKNKEDLFDKNLFLSEEIERLTEENKDLQIQTKDVRLRLSDESSLQKRINEHLSLMVILFAEIESLRRRVIDKEKEVQYVRRSSLSPHMLKH